MQGYLIQLRCQCGVDYTAMSTEKGNYLECLNKNCMNRGKRFVIPQVNLELVQDFTPKHLKIDKNNKTG